MPCFSAPCIFAAVFKNQLDSRAEALTALFNVKPLAVRAGNLRRPGDKPIAVPLNDRCEFIAHGESIARNRSKICLTGGDHGH